MSNIIQDSEFPYMPPCIKCKPIIEYSNIKFHSESIPYELQIFQDSDYKFGIFDIAIRGEIPISQKHLHIFFTIDASGSMNDKCIDGRTKMEYILFTLENILRIFHEKTESSIHIQSFDSSINTVISDISNIKESDIECIITKVNQIRPGKSTNIELALRSAKEQIDIYKESNSQHEVVHIFLTDGEITVGSKDDELLKSIVPKDCKNIFIGYGLDHDSHLLSLLSSENDNEYRFIDALDKAGLVYGEIIHSILYKAITDVSIKAARCELYDYKTNNWTSELKIGNLLSEQKNTYHLRSKIPTQSTILVMGKTIIKTRQFQIMTNDIQVQTYNSGYTNIYYGDLTKYIFRQRTQELLYEVKSISEKQRDYKIPIFTDADEFYGNDKIIKEEMKTKLKTFLNLMVDYMKKNNMESDSIMKMLCDDIYILYKTIGTSVSNMFSSARQTSQGRQQSYTAATINSQEQQKKIDLQTPDNFNCDELPPCPPSFGLRRQIIMDIDSDVDYDPVIDANLVDVYVNDDGVDVNDDGVDVDDDDATTINDDINYTFTQTFISPYSSAGIITSMRDITGNDTVVEEFISQKTNKIY